MPEISNVLMVGAEQPYHRPLIHRLKSWAERVEQVETADDGLRRLKSLDYQLVLAVGRTPDLSTERLVEEMLRATPNVVILLIAAQANLSHAFRAARLGASDYLVAEPNAALDPQAAQRLFERVRDSYARARAEATPSAAVEADEGETPELIGRSPAMRKVNHLVKLIAPRQSTVLIEGRTGTGKELVARAIHARSQRANKPMVMVNCGAIPASLLEAEFFGHVKGAFTGAVSGRVGRFEQADGGTIFLDEVGEMPLEMQSKLLRVLQEREFQRVGTSETRTVDVRVIAATNCELREMVERGEFREDLYYRLNVVPIEIPSLTERIEDIPLLAEHLLAKTCEAEGLPLRRASRETQQRLQDYGWPGNVRQLENAIAKAVALSGERQVLFPSDFPLPALPPAGAGSVVPEIRVPPNGLDYDGVVTRIEHSLLQQALDLTNGNKKRAADLLHIKRTTFAARWRSVQDSLELVGQGS